LMWSIKGVSARHSREISFTLVLAALIALLVVQLSSLQVVQHRRYLAKSLGNKIRAIPIFAPRGEIFDRAGRPLAVNRPAYTLKYFPPAGEPESDQTLAHLAQWLGVDRDELVESVSRQRTLLYSFQPVTVASEITLEQVAYVEENPALFPGCFVDVDASKRYYPLGSAAAHLVGYTAMMTQDEFEAKRVAGYLANEFLGKEGIERQYEGLLHGRLGERDIEVDRNRCFRRIVVEKPPSKGEDLYITIDSRVQKAAYESLGNRRGAAIVMKPRTGEVLALACSPSYDPNRFRDEDGGDYLARIISNTRYPMLNRAVGNAYAPASTVKPAVVLGALESGIISRGSTFYCPGFLQIGNRKFYDWKREGHGTLGIVDVIGKSSDVALYRIGLDMGLLNLRHYYREFGFGKPTGIDLPQEAGGLVPSAEWKREHYSGERYNEVDRIWYDGDTANLAIGQGYMLATPLQVLVMVNTIANDGLTAKPTLLKGTKSSVGVDLARRALPQAHGFDRENLDLIKRGMRRAALLGGTAEDLRTLPVPVAGKTGTAEVWMGEPHSWFVGYFPSDDPQVSFVIFIENGGSSHDAAVPAARKLISDILGILEM